MENRQRTKAVYAVMKQTCDDMGVTYKADDGAYKLSFTSVGEDLHIPVTIRLLPENKVLTVLCECPFDVPKRGRDNIALATSMINFALADGSFDFDYRFGKLVFRVTSSYYDSLIGKEAIYRMLTYALVLTDKYNDKLLGIALGTLSLDDFAAMQSDRGY